MEKQKKSISCKCLWIGIIGVYVNFIVFLFTDFSFWYFLALTACIGIGICLINQFEGRNKKLDPAREKKFSK